MSSVYTFCPPQSTGNSISKNTNGNSQEPQAPIEFNEMNFPSLSISKPKSNNGNIIPSIDLTQMKTVSSQPQGSCWGNKSVLETVKLPFPVQPIAPKSHIPPLFNTVRKNKARVYEEDEETDSDDEYEYEYESEPEHESDSDDDDFN
jgi:hypothetical protein